MDKNERLFLTVLETVLGDYGLSPVIAWALRFFLRNPYESLVVVDKHGKVVFMDKGSEKFFGLPEWGAKGIEVTELIPDSGLPKVLETQVPLIGRLFDVKNIQRIGSAYPLIRDGEVTGAIGRLIFRSMEEVERVNKEIHQLKNVVKTLREGQRGQYRAHYTFESILGISTAIKDVIEIAKKVSMIDTDVMILGESGTGKELFAQAIHNFNKPERPFVRVNCPAIPFELAESELFGYEKGAFSGADSAGKPGKFELANNGTIFLDEVSSLPLSIQAKLLRILQEKEVERLGGTRIERLNFRLIAAANSDLQTLVKEGKFREDLYYRIAKAALSIPPLRERKEDLPVYINHFLKTVNERFGTRFTGLSDEALNYFIKYDWPGNVRELINALEHSCLTKWEGDEIPAISLPSGLIGGSTPTSLSPPKGFKKEILATEKRLLLQALEITRGNKRRAAFLLRMPRSSFYKKLRDCGIEI